MDTPTHQQRKVIDRATSLSNKDLLDEVLSLAQGDDWDGSFTKHGLWEYEYHKAELEKRLENWLNTTSKLDPPEDTAGE